MATWIAHLRIAENLLELIPGLDESWFAIGNITPDSGIPDENWENFTPPGHITHFKSETEGAFGSADLRFYRQYLTSIAWPGDDPKKFSFLLGYFFHLIADNVWSFRIGKPTQEKFTDEFEADPKFIWEVKRDWYGLDLIYVRDHPNSLFWRTFLNCQYTDNYLDFMPAEAVHQRIEYIQEFYQRTDERVQAAYQRPYIYLSTEQYEAFVDETTQLSLRAYQYLWQKRLEPENQETILEILGI